MLDATNFRLKLWSILSIRGHCLLSSITLRIKELKGVSIFGLKSQKVLIKIYLVFVILSIITMSDWHNAKVGQT